VRRGDWAVPLALLALSFVPVVVGVARVVALGAGDPSIAPRFVASPMPFVLHALSATTYAVLGALQFSRGLRVRWPAWHRRLGRVAGLAGLSTAGSGLWMALTYVVPLSQQGPLLLTARLVVGAAMLVALVLGIVRIWERDVAAHEAWMIRAYALGQGAGTQVLLLGIPALALGELEGLPRDVLMVASWLLNALVAEAIVRGRGALTVGAAAAAP
jgi:uncharacterized membrane protein